MASRILQISTHIHGQSPGSLDPTDKYICMGSLGPQVEKVAAASQSKSEQVRASQSKCVVQHLSRWRHFGAVNSPVVDLQKEHEHERHGHATSQCPGRPHGTDIEVMRVVN
jgi:hypothetical protein